MTDPTLFDHFVQAQDDVYDTVISELSAGEKKTHWMWFVFPQIQGLGTSPLAERYALASVQQASEYLTHPILAERLVQCSELLLSHTTLTAHQMLGTPDDLKLKSCMTLFELCESGEAVFSKVLEQFFRGQQCQHTLTFRAEGKV